MRNLPCAMLVLLAATALNGGAPKGTGIRSTDFKNFSFPWDNNMRKPPSYDVSPWQWLIQLPQSRIHLVDGVHPNQMSRNWNANVLRVLVFRAPRMAILTRTA